MKSDDDEKISPEDRALFRDSVKGTKPLHQEASDRSEKRAPADQSAAAPATSSPKHIKTKDYKPKHRRLQDFPLSDNSPNPVNAETFVEYIAKGISHKDMKRLKSGDFHIDGALDLHGSTTEEARIAFLNFLEKAFDRGWHCVRIVHGKGLHGQHGAVLKNLVNTWLRQLPSIVAFCSAPPRDGGAGAVYVLLSRHS